MTKASDVQHQRSVRASQSQQSKETVTHSSDGKLSLPDHGSVNGSSTGTERHTRNINACRKYHTYYNRFCLFKLASTLQVGNGFSCSSQVSHSEGVADVEREEHHVTNSNLSVASSAAKQDVEEPSLSLSDLKQNRHPKGLDRIVTKCDIQFISGYEKVAKMSLQLGWLMFQRDDYSLMDVRNTLMKDVLDQPDCTKVTHVIEEWRRCKQYEATVRALIDICCQHTIGCDRQYMESTLNSLPQLHYSSSGK